MQVNLRAWSFTHNIDRKVISPKLKIDEVEIEQVKEYNCLVIQISEQLNCKSHVEYIFYKISSTTLTEEIVLLQLYWWLFKRSKSNS